MRHNILFVDDEPSVLNSMKRELRKEPFMAYTAETVQDAIDILTKEEISVIVSDMRMPVMSGTQFLEKAHEMNPDSVKLILSGHSDMNDVMEAINRGHVWRYLTKPWKKEDLLVTLNNAVAFYELGCERKVLFNELQLKNKELEDMNRVLEDRVRAQTKEIQDRNALLKMLVDGEKIDVIVEHALACLAETLDNNELAVFDKNDKLLFSRKNCDECAYNVRCCEYRKIVYKDYKPYISPENDLYYPLVCEGDGYGILVVGKSIANKADIERILSGYGVILALVLKQGELFSEAPQVIDSINDILGEFE